MLFRSDRIANVFYHSTNDDLYSFCFHRFVLNEVNVGVIAIGSGGPKFLPMYTENKVDVVRNYKASINSNEYSDWEQGFISMINGFYRDVSKLDDTVGADTNIYML